MERHKNGVSKIRISLCFLTKMWSYFKNIRCTCAKILVDKEKRTHKHGSGIACALIVTYIILWPLIPLPSDIHVKIMQEFVISLGIWSWKPLIPVEAQAVLVPFNSTTRNIYQKKVRHFFAENKWQNENRFSLCMAEWDDLYVRYVHVAFCFIVSNLNRIHNV